MLHVLYAQVKSMEKQFFWPGLIKIHEGDIFFKMTLRPMVLQNISDRYQKVENKQITFLNITCMGLEFSGW